MTAEIVPIALSMPIAPITFVHQGLEMSPKYSIFLTLTVKVPESSETPGMSAIGCGLPKKRMGKTSRPFTLLFGVADKPSKLGTHWRSQRQSILVSLIYVCASSIIARPQFCRNSAFLPDNVL